MYHQQREGVGSRGEVGGGTGGPICLAGQFMHEIIGKFDIFGSRNQNITYFIFYNLQSYCHGHDFDCSVLVLELRQIYWQQFMRSWSVYQTTQYIIFHTHTHTRMHACTHTHTHTHKIVFCLSQNSFSHGSKILNVPIMKNHSAFKSKDYHYQNLKYDQLYTGMLLEHAAMESPTPQTGSIHVYRSLIGYLLSVHGHNLHILQTRSKVTAPSRRG